MVLGFKDFNNSLKLIIINFILRFKLKDILLVLKLKKLDYSKPLTFDNF